jgi:hypothetical protein
MRQLPLCKFLLLARKLKTARSSFTARCRDGRKIHKPTSEDYQMTNFIYRGVKHDGQRTTISRKAQNLIYRGFAHDGLPPAATPFRNSHAVLCYRGIRYTLAANGDVLLCGA